MGLQYDQDNSLPERIKRELLSPSKRTVLIFVVVIVLAVSPFIAGLIDTAQDGIGEVTADHDLNENMAASVGDLEDDKIAPWLVSQAEIMRAATTPLQWEIGNFYYGNCSTENIGEMPAGAYRDAIDSACGSLADIQGKYGRDCYIAANCEVKQSTKDELTVVIDKLWAAHGEAGYVR